MKVSYRIVSGRFIDSHGLFKIKLQSRLFNLWYTLDYKFAYAGDKDDIMSMIDKLKQTLARRIEVSKATLPTILINFDEDGKEIK